MKVEIRRGTLDDLSTIVDYNYRMALETENKVSRTSQKLPNPTQFSRMFHFFLTLNTNVLQLTSHFSCTSMHLEIQELPLDILTKGCANVLGDSTKGRYYVLEEDGQLAAQLMITLEWSDWRNSDCW